MSIPVFCKGCNEIVGTAHAMMGIVPGASEWNGKCPGKGKHPKPQRSEQRKFFGWLKDVHSYQPDTGNTSMWTEYVGPSSRFCLWLAMFLKGGLDSDMGGRRDSLLVNHKWCWSNGLGDGWKEVVSDGYKKGLVNG